MRIELNKYNAHVELPYYGSVDEVLYIDERNIQALTIDDETIHFPDNVTKTLLRIVLQENTALTINFFNLEDVGNIIEKENRDQLFKNITKEMNKQYKERKS